MPVDLQDLLPSDAPQLGCDKDPLCAHVLHCQGNSGRPLGASLQLSCEAPDSAVYSQLLALIEPYAHDHHKWDVWAEEEDATMSEEDVQVGFCMASN